MGGGLDHLGGQRTRFSSPRIPDSLEALAQMSDDERPATREELEKAKKFDEQALEQATTELEEEVRKEESTRT